MENKTKLTMGVSVALTLFLGSGATYFFGQDDDAFYCESRNLVMLCEKLSSGIGTRCYYEETYKVCTEGWEKIEMDQIPLNVNGTNDYICDDSEFIKECRNQEGNLILRIKNE